MPKPKWPKTRDTSLRTKPELPPLVRRGPPAKPVDLTRDDAELVSHISTASDDSEDSLIPSQWGRERDIQSMVRSIKRNDGKSLELITIKPQAEGASFTEGEGGKLTYELPEKHNPTPELMTFTHGSKGKGKAVPALPLTDLVRGTEHLQEPREYFLSWAVEQDNPTLRVISVKGHLEFSVNMKSGVRKLQVVTSRNLGDPIFLIHDRWLPGIRSRGVTVHHNVFYERSAAEPRI